MTETDQAHSFPHEALADQYDRTFNTSTDYLKKLEERKTRAENAASVINDPQAPQWAKAEGEKEKVIFKDISADIDRQHHLGDNGLQSMKATLISPALKIKE